MQSNVTAQLPSQELENPEIIISIPVKQWAHHHLKSGLRWAPIGLRLLGASDCAPGIVCSGTSMRLEFLGAGKSFCSLAFF